MYSNNGIYLKGVGAVCVFCASSHFLKSLQWKCQVHMTNSMTKATAVIVGNTTG